MSDSSRERKLLTLEEFNALPPRSQGYASYMQAELPGSKLPKKCPAGYGIKERHEWQTGERLAVLEVQDYDE
jgi:hypothetical protein